MSHGLPSVAAVRRVFDTRAADFHQYAFVHDEVRRRLLDRLEGVNVAPQRMLDVGCADGRAAAALTQRFPAAELMMLDASWEMARKARSGGGQVINAALPQLPLVDGCLGLVFANLCLPYCDNVRGALMAVARVLEPGGLFAFATLGPDSFQELQLARAALGQEVRPVFADMHHLGDALVGSGMTDPVLDVDTLEVSYRDWPTLWRELIGSGSAPGQSPTGGLFAGPGPSLALEAAYPRVDDERPYHVTLELVFGHAWRSGPTTAMAGPHEVTVPVPTIKSR